MMRGRQKGEGELWSRLRVSRLESSARGQGPRQRRSRMHIVVQQDSKCPFSFLKRSRSQRRNKGTIAAIPSMPLTRIEAASPERSVDADERGAEELDREGAEVG